MSEPISSSIAAALVAATVGATAWFTRLDPLAVIGAFAGSVTFALTAKDTDVWRRLTYMLVSLVVGYAAVPDVAALSPLKNPLFIAYIVSALVVHTTLTVIDRIKTMDVAATWAAIVAAFKK